MRPLRLLPLLLCLLLCGCYKNEFKIRFEVAQSVNNPCKIIYYASSSKQGMVRETAAEINAGKGLTVLPTRYPTIVYLFSQSQKEPALAFYAERGDEIVVTGDSPNVADWEVSGNKLTDEWSRWRTANRKVLAEGKKEKINKAVAEYVEKHTDSKLSLVLLCMYYSRRDDQEGFSRLYGKLKEGAFDDKDLLSALSAADLLEGPGSGWYVGKGGISSPKSIILRGQDGYADTLALNDSTATLILFTGKEGMKPGIKDSIQSLLRGGKGKIADIYTEPDTISWRRHISNDSIASLRRLMLPLGLADSTAIALGVVRVPYYLTVAPDGHLLYRGDEFAKAAGAFRSAK